MLFLSISVQVPSNRHSEGSAHGGLCILDGNYASHSLVEAVFHSVCSPEDTSETIKRLSVMISNEILLWTVGRTLRSSGRNFPTLSTGVRCLTVHFRLYRQTYTHTDSRHVVCVWSTLKRMHRSSGDRGRWNSSTVVVYSGTIILSLWIMLYSHSNHDDMVQVKQDSCLITACDWRKRQHLALCRSQHHIFMTPVCLEAECICSERLWEFFASRSLCSHTYAAQVTSNLRDSKVSLWRYIEIIQCLHNTCALHVGDVWSVTRVQ